MNRHLAVDHPDFKYQPSPNPYSRKIDEWSKEGLCFGEGATEQFAGRWREQFRDGVSADTRRKLHVEVGCNAGHVILEWAAQNPQNAYIGVDWKPKAIGRAAEKAKKRGLKNVIFLRAQAARLPYIFAAGEVDEIAIFFPDPWPKKAHWKHRWVTAARLQSLNQVLGPKGQLHIKTDHPEYFAWMLDAHQQTQALWKTLQLSHDKHAGHPDPLLLSIPEVTLFERLFIRDGLPIHELRLEKPHDASPSDPR